MGWPKNRVVSVVMATVMMSLIVVCINGSNVVTIMTLKCLSVLWILNIFFF